MSDTYRSFLEVEGYGGMALLVLVYGTGLVLAITSRRRYPRVLPYAVAAFICKLLVQIGSPIAVLAQFGAGHDTDALLRSELVGTFSSAVFLVLNIAALVLIVMALVHGPLARGHRTAPQGEVR